MFGFVFLFVLQIIILKFGSEWYYYARESMEWQEMRPYLPMAFLIAGIMGYPLGVCFYHFSTRSTGFVCPSCEKIYKSDAESQRECGQTLIKFSEAKWVD